MIEQMEIQQNKKHKNRIKQSETSFSMQMNEKKNRE